MRFLLLSLLIFNSNSYSFEIEFLTLISGAKTRVAFFEVTDSRGQQVKFQNSTRFAHMALEINGSWLHSHPIRGVEYISHFKDMGFHSYKTTYKYIPTSMINQVILKQLEGLPYDPDFEWNDNKIYCSELVAKVLGLPPTAMTGIKYRGKLGISPDEIYDFL